jgi:hypothetical protein
MEFLEINSNMNPQSLHHPTKIKNRLASTSLIISVLAILAVIFGTFIPTNELHVPVIRNTGGGHFDYGLAFLLPGLLGFLGAGMGIVARHQIRKSPVPISGDGGTGFAILVGLLAGMFGLVDLFLLLE